MPEMRNMRQSSRHEDENREPEMKRRERFRRPSSYKQSVAISTKRALLMLAICILCMFLTKMLS